MDQMRLNIDRNNSNPKSENRGNASIGENDEEKEQTCKSYLCRKSKPRNELQKKKIKLKRKKKNLKENFIRKKKNSYKKKERRREWKSKFVSAFYFI